MYRRKPSNGAAVYATEPRTPPLPDPAIRLPDANQALSCYLQSVYINDCLPTAPLTPLIAPDIDGTPCQLLPGALSTVFPLMSKTSLLLTFAMVTWVNFHMPRRFLICILGDITRIKIGNPIWRLSSNDAVFQCLC